MARSYLPGKLTSFVAWFTNFNTLVQANPALYGLTSADATSINSQYNTFSAAYALSSSPSTRTPVTVQDTQTARNSATVIIRTYGRLIGSNAGVADADKTALGLIIRDPIPTPVPGPLTNPVVSIIGCQAGQITAKYHDSASGGNVKAKPFGATQIQLYVLFGMTAPVSAAATPFYGVATKTPFVINCPSGSAGQNAYIYARWITQKGLVGPWSPLAVTAVV